MLKDILVTLQSPERTWAFEMYSIAKELYARGKDKEALEYLEDAVNGNGNNRGYRYDSKNHLLKGIILLGSKEEPNLSIIDLPKAREAFDIAAEYSFPTKEQIAESGMLSEQLFLPYYEAVCSSAWTSYCMGDFTTAISSYEEAILQCPSKSRAYYFLGKVLAHIGKRKPALQNFERAIRINHVRAASAILDKDYLNYSDDLAKCIDAVRLERIKEAKDYARFILMVRSDTDVWGELGSGSIKHLADDCSGVVNGDLSLSEISASKSAIVIAAQGAKQAASEIKERLAQEVSRLSSEARKRDTSPTGNWSDEMTGFGGAFAALAFAHVALAALLIALGLLILPVVKQYPWPTLEYSFPDAWRFIKSIYIWVVAAAAILPFLIPLLNDKADRSKNEKAEDARVQSVRARLDPKANLVKTLEAMLKEAPS